MRFFLVEPKSCFHAGDFVARRGAIASICRRPASLDLGLAFRCPISRARRQMRGDRIKCLGLRTYRTSCINATDSICRRARMESQSVVKRGQGARVDDESNRSRSACGNATCGIDPDSRLHSRTASTSFQSRKRLGKSMGFRVPARSAAKSAARASTNRGDRASACDEVACVKTALGFNKKRGSEGVE